MAYTFKHFLLCGFAILTLSACGSDQQSGMQRPAAPVGVLDLKARPVILYSEMPGRTVAYETAEVRPEVTGIIQERVYQEGSYVNKGDILYNIDADLYKASYDSAKANLARAEAAVNVARLKESRMSMLRKKNAISQQDYDEARAVYLQANAEVAAARAALQTAKINLDRTEISAPISGLIGKSSVSVGTLVANNQVNALSTIYQIDPMNVDITESVETLVKLRSRENAQEDMKKLQDLNIPVKLLLEDGKEYKHIGKLEFIDIGVDTGTATMTLRASFPNSDYQLMPGLFIRAKVQVGIEENAMLVPQRSIVRDTRGNPYVFVAEGYKSGSTPSKEAPIQAKAVRRYVTLGDTYGENWMVLEGLKSGETIIVEGLQKVTDAAMVNVIKTAELNIPADADYLGENRVKPEGNLNEFIEKEEAHPESSSDKKQDTVQNGGKK